jgi:hypothetical protein
MRGVVALAAAISLPETLENGDPFPQRSVILFMTFCVIFVTLVVQGLTLPALIRRLGLAGLSSGNNEEEEARRTMIGAALKHLERSEEKDVPELAPIYEDLAMHYQRRLASLMRRERNRGEISLQQDQIYRNLAQTLRKIDTPLPSNCGTKTKSTTRSCVLCSVTWIFWRPKPGVRKDLCRIKAAHWWSEQTFLASGLLQESRLYC